MSAVTYRVLLRLLPTSFRQEYGAEMEAVLADRLAAAEGLPGRVGLWIAAVTDLLRTSVREHVDLLGRDVRVALRGFRREPLFPAVVLLTLALGIGAVTAMFSLVDHVLLRPLPFPEPERLVRIWERAPAFGYSQVEATPPNYRDWVERGRAFSGLAAWVELEVDLTGAASPERLRACRSTASLFRVLGARTVAGRTLGPGDDPHGAPDVVVLGHDLFRSRFGGDPAIVGRDVTLDGRPHRVVGVLVPEFRFPSREVDVWLPLRFDEEGWRDRTNHWLQVVGRLADGVGPEAASADLERISRILEREHPETNEGASAVLRPFGQQLRGRSGEVLVLLSLAAASVLAIGCANLANLLLARASRRRAELALRTVLGAGRGRLVRQMITENLLLAGAGGLLGVGLARLALPVLAHLVPGSFPVAAGPGLDGRVLLFAVLLSGLAVLLFGLHPARVAARTAPAEALRGAGRGATGAGGQRTRRILVVVQVALSAALLVAAGLLLRALAQVGDVEPGFRSEGILTARTVLPESRYPTRADRQRFYDEVLGRVRVLPGVRSAGYTGFLPFVMKGIVWPFGTAEQDPATAEPPHPIAVFRMVTRGYLETLEIPLLKGRQFGPEDGPGAPLRAVVGRSLAEHLWPGRDPVGRELRFFWPWLDETWTVVGVVGDVRARGLERELPHQIWVLHDQIESLSFHAPRDLAVAVDGDPEGIAADVRRIVAEIDPEQPLSDVRPLAEIVAAETGDRRRQLRLLGLFAGLGLAMAALGIYGVLSLLVAGRRRELAVRLALGARPTEMVRRVLGQGVGLCALGLVPGVVGGLALGRALRALLAGVGPADPAAVGGAVAVCLAAGLAAAALPALRAGRVEPASVLRAE